MLFGVLPLWSLCCGWTSVLMYRFLTLDIVAAAPASARFMIHFGFWIGIANVLVALGFAAFYYLPLWLAARGGYRVEVLQDQGIIRVPGEGQASVTQENPGLIIGSSPHRIPPEQTARLVLKRQARLPGPNAAAAHGRRAIVRLLRLGRSARPPDDTLVISIRLLKDRKAFVRLHKGLRTRPAHGGSGPAIPLSMSMAGGGPGVTLTAPTVTFRLRTGRLLVGFFFWTVMVLCGVAGAFAMAEILPASFHTFPILGQMKALIFCFSVLIVLVVGPAVAFEFAALWFAATFSGYRVEVSPQTGAVHLRGDGTAYVSQQNPGRGIRQNHGKNIDARRLLILHGRSPVASSTAGARMLAHFFRLSVRLRELKRPPDAALYVPVPMLHDAEAFIRMIETFRTS